MKSLIKLTAASGMLAMLLGCSGAPDVGSDLEALRNMDASGASEFNQALFADYAAYAVYEAEFEADAEYIYLSDGEVDVLKDVGIFVRKAISASKNEIVAPEEISDWSIPNDRAIILNAHRTMMMNEFAKGAKVSHPELAGRAQGRFDCWVEEEAEGHENPECMLLHKAAMLNIKSP